MALPVRSSSRKAQPPQMFPSAGKRLYTTTSQLYHLDTNQNQHHSKESYAQSFGLQSHWELISTRLASRIENGKTQPPHWRRKTQPPHWRRKTQPSHWRRKTQPPHWRRETQPPYWRRKTTQRSLGMICGNTNCQDVSVLESNKILKE
jgi:hypothetical protein